MTEIRHVESIIDFVAALVSLRDPFENGHIERVAIWSEKIARQMKLDPHLTELIKHAAALHDIGKLMIAESILNKPKLSASERIMINGHAVLGFRVALATRLDAEICLAIRHHHENFNGSGYPDKLKGKQIPVAARIVRVVDCYDAMNSKRPYHEMMSPAQTMLIMEKENGSSFDPEIFEIFKQIIKT